MYRIARGPEEPLQVSRAKPLEPFIQQSVAFAGEGEGSGTRLQGVGLIGALYQGERGLDNQGERPLEPFIKESVAFAGGVEGRGTRLERESALLTTYWSESTESSR